jgi:thioredoxin reductase
VLGAGLAGCAAAVYNARALLEHRITPRSITALNACTYVGLFRRVP